MATHYGSLWSAGSRILKTADVGLCEVGQEPLALAIASKGSDCVDFYAGLYREVERSSSRSFILSLTMYNTNKVFLGQGLPMHLAFAPG